jgi:hypothetical protein
MANTARYTGEVSLYTATVCERRTDILALAACDKVALQKAAMATPEKAIGRGQPGGVDSEAKSRATDAALHVASHRICPGCGTALIDRGCKMRCLRCGFFLDCSDG